MLAIVTIAGFVAATACGHPEVRLPLGFVAGALATAGAALIFLEHLPPVSGNRPKSSGYTTYVVGHG